NRVLVDWHSAKQIGSLDSENQNSTGPEATGDQHNPGDDLCDCHALRLHLALVHERNSGYGSLASARARRSPRQPGSGSWPLPSSGACAARRPTLGAGTGGDALGVSEPVRKQATVFGG